MHLTPRTPVVKGNLCKAKRAGRDGARGGRAKLRALPRHTADPTKLRTLTSLFHTTTLTLSPHNTLVTILSTRQSWCRVQDQGWGVVLGRGQRQAASRA